eukprot:EG_transcript_19021
MVCLRGTLPIHHHVASYDVPLAIWVCLPYPAVAPLVHVFPTPTLAIKPNHYHVNQADGRCTIPYLQAWAAHSHHLQQLCSELVAHFSEDPPLYTPVPYAHAFDENPAREGCQSTQMPSRTRSIGAVVLDLCRPSSSSPCSALATKRRKLEHDQSTLFVKIMSSLASLTGETDTLLQQATTEKAGLEEQRVSAMGTLQSLHRQKDQHDAEIEAVCHYLNANDRPIDGDAASCPRLPIATQRLELVAEDLALDDAVHHLNQGLHSGLLGFAAWLQAIRNASRKQFEARALAMKCQAALDREFGPGPGHPPASSCATPSSSGSVLASLHTSILF